MYLPVVLVTGKNGQLGSELQQLAVQYKALFLFFFTDKCQLDFTNQDSVYNFF